MPQRESEAIVLRCYSLGEADRLVSFLSRQWGRMRGAASGAKKTKSRFGATLEPLSYIRIWYFERETRDLVRISQCEMIESFMDAQRDYTCNLALSQMAEVTEAVLPEREASDASFRLLLLGARTIKQTGKPFLPLLYFNLWVVRLGGWLPQLDRCVKCDAVLAASGAYASPVHPGLLCPRCKLPGMRFLSAPGLAAAHEILQEKLEALVARDWPNGKGRDLSEYMLDVIEQQIERKLTTRRMMESSQ